MNATTRVKSLEVNLNGHDCAGFLRTENKTSAEKVNEDIVEEDGENAHEKFMEELASVCTDVSKNKQTYSAMAREAVIGLMSRRRRAHWRLNSNVATETMTMPMWLK